VEVTVVQTFDVALRMTPYDEFIRRIAARVELAGFLMTPDAAFGHERGGTVDAVTELGRSMGFDVAVVPPFELDGRPVRSSDIRAAIASGDLAGAERLLGRPYSIVVEADGSTLRFTMPVALPPADDYPVVVESAPDSGDQVADRSARLIVAGLESVLLEVDGMPPGRRKVTFAAGD
jgi:FAD synthase